MEETVPTGRHPVPHDAVMEHMPTIFQKIRTTTQAIVQQAQQVKINEDQLEAYIKKLPLEKIDNPPLDPNTHYLGKGVDTLAFFLTLETINFGSGYFPHLKNHIEGSGYFTVAEALKKYYDKNGPIPASQLVQLTGKDCAAIFNQPWEMPIQELMELFAQALNQLGYFLQTNFDGKYEAVFEEADHSAEKLVTLLMQIPCFYDVARYGNIEVPILKRAQITAADVSLAFKNKGLGYFKDLDQLTIFADNMVPHVLRCDGILTYRADLATIIDNRQLLPAGSKGEIELRACAIHTVELIKQRFQEKGYDFTSVDLDYLLWNRGQAAFYETTYPIHLTRTTFY